MKCWHPPFAYCKSLSKPCDDSYYHVYFDSLVDVLQKAEIALVDVSGGQPPRKGATSSAMSVGSSKGVKSKPPVSRAKAASPKLKKDEAIEVKLIPLILLP